MNSKTHIVILGLLSEQALSGYDIKRLIDIRFRFFWNESYGQIYPTLKKMSNDHTIQAIPSPVSKRSKQKYEITDLGRQTLKSWQEEKPEKETIRIELLLKLFFGSGNNPKYLIDYVKGFQTSHNQDLIILNKFKQELSMIPDPFQHHQNILSVIDFGIKTNTAYLDWCHETLLKLENTNEQK